MRCNQNSRNIKQPLFFRYCFSDRFSIQWRICQRFFLRPKNSRFKSFTVIILQCALLFCKQLKLIVTLLLTLFYNLIAMKINTTNHPAPWFKEMREERPVYYDPDIVFYFGAKGAWQVFRYEDVKYGITNVELFSNEFIPKQKTGLGDSIAMTDPPRHKVMRSLIGKAFVPSIMSQIDGWVKTKSENLLLPWLQKGKMDFIKEMADPVPPSVVAQILGIDESFHANITSWTKTLIGDPSIIGLEAYQEVQQEMVALITQLINDRMQQPQEDLTSYLIKSELDGERLTPDELVANCLALMTAGIEAPAGLMGNAMLTLTERPELQQQLARQPEDLPKFINEILRWRCPVLSIPRLARQDLQLNGQQIRKGELVNFWLASANLDPQVFPDPETFDMNRDYSKILSFGSGIHGCIGSHLTRLETRIVFETVFKHIHNITIAPDNTLTRIPNVSTFKFSSLLINFDTH